MIAGIRTALIVLAVFMAFPCAAAQWRTERGSQLAQNAGEFEVLNGAQIKRLFANLEEAAYPPDGSSFNNDEWQVTFRSDGTWEGISSPADAWGEWRVEGDSVCVSVSGGETEWSAPFVGCFGISVRWSDATIAASFPDLKLSRFVLLKAAFVETARVRPRQPAAPPATKLTRQQDRQLDMQQREAQRKHALELQRLAMERKRLAEEMKLSKLRLELERQKLAQQREALARRQQMAADTQKPVIETRQSIVTADKTVAITGTVRDDRKVVRLEVAGNRIAFDSATGRFATTVPVQLGQNRIRVSALDGSGNKTEQVVAATRNRAIPDVAFGSFHAVVIGINDYSALPKLKTAIDDARAVAQVLEESYGYNVYLLENPTRADIIDKLDELRESLSQDDNLLIYYAGHGWLDEQSGRGYWLPSNARADRRSRWVSNADLTDALQALHAKHVMVVADSCYSGTLTRSVKVPERNHGYIKRIAEKRARVVLSSGGLEPVSDSGGGRHSVFAAQFLKALRSNEGVLDGTQIFEKVRQNVVLNADQTPEYSDIRRAGHEGGDFLFVRRD